MGQASDGLLVDAIDPAWDGEYADISSTDHTFSKLTRSLYVGTGGVVIAVLYSGNSVTFSNVQDGSILPIRVKSITKTGTTASDIVGIW